MENEDYERTEKEYREADHASEGTSARSHHHDSDLPTEEKVSPSYPGLAIPMKVLINLIFF